jgi:NAD-dependent SIR2 family protein deacetylase
MLAVKTFRRMALGMDGALESAHMGHPDFRANGKIFATIQTNERGMVKLTPEQQQKFVADYPEAFLPERGPGDARAAPASCLPQPTRNRSGRP